MEQLGVAGSVYPVIVRFQSHFFASLLTMEEVLPHVLQNLAK